jgi:DNA-binding MarR family transcriptional regulator
MALPFASELAAVSATCACLHTRMAARSITRAFDAALKPLGLETTQFTLLAAILADPSRSVTALAERLALERTSLSRNLALLVRRGLVTPEKKGGRAVAYGVTEEGKRLIAEAMPRWQEMQDRLEASIGADGWRETQGRLRQMRHALRTLETAEGTRLKEKIPTHSRNPHPDLVDGSGISTIRAIDLDPSTGSG